MLTIRQAQMQALGKERSAGFEQSLILYIKENFAHLAPDAESFVEKAQKGASAYKLTAKRDITGFVKLSAAVGLDFAQQPAHAWIKVALVDERISSPSVRLRFVIAEYQHRLAVKQHNAQVRRPSPPALPGWAQ